MVLVMKNRIHIIIQHSLALATSYLIWLLLYTQLPITKEYSETPVSFFNTPDTEIIEAPETVIIKLQASRAILDATTPHIYIDAQNLPYDHVWHYPIEHKNLLVPHHINMVYCYPTVISIKKRQL
jgi:hypothetical protein